jgi:large subunit ribosomal protein L4
MKTPLYTLKNETVGEVDLPQTLFGIEWKPELVHQAVVAQQANLRRPWAHVRTRGEVRGGGKKPWQQKGTGRARHGSTRSPIWIGGGKSHGPRNDKSYEKELPKKMRRMAMLSVLSKKFADNELRVVQDFNVAEPKTKALFAVLAPFLGLSKRAKKIDALIIRNPENTTITRIARNLNKAKVLAPQSLNVYDLVNYKTILIDAGSLAALEERYAK